MAAVAGTQALPATTFSVVARALMVILVPVVLRMIMPRRLGAVPMARWRRIVRPVVVVIVYGRDQRWSICRTKCRVINGRPCEGGANDASAGKQAKTKCGCNEKATHRVLHPVFDGCRMECRQGADRAELPPFRGSL